MSFTDEWKCRVGKWRDKLKNFFFTPLGEIELSGFTTKDRIPFKEAAQRKYRPMPRGTEWGDGFEYCWFKCEVTIPDRAAGRRIVGMIIPGDPQTESTVYINGRLSGAIRRGAQYYNHLFSPDNALTLSRHGKPGELFELHLESFSWNPAPYTVRRELPPSLAYALPDNTLSRVGKSTFGIFEEDIYQLWLDIETLWGIRENMDEDSLRVMEIDQGLKDFATNIDFAEAKERLIEDVKKCRERLKPLFECQNGTSIPTFYTFGHSHLDAVWFWPLEVTKGKIARTFALQLGLMEEYPEYKFLASQPFLYDIVKKLYPELYERVRRKVTEGDFIPEGGMWVESDTNLPSGESLIRQFIHGKRFFKEEFGLDSRLAWLPDVFGYSGAFPQIMKGCGMDYFSTTKLFWRIDGGEPFPYDVFLWEGIDGTTILSGFCDCYNNQTRPQDLILSWKERRQKEGVSTRLHPFGYGDGGGGATRDHLEYLKRQKDLEGTPRVAIQGPVAYFKDLEQRGIPAARYVGELYYQRHRGTYTTQSLLKRENRKSEFAAREAEMWGSAALVLKGYPYPYERMDAAWKKILLNQFHDVLPGSCGSRGRIEALELYRAATLIFQKTTEDAVATLDLDSCRAAGSGSGLKIFNSLSWNRRELIRLPEGFSGCQDASGRSLPVQKLKESYLTEVEVPSCGWTIIYPGRKEEGERGARDRDYKNTLVVSKDLLENEFLSIKLNANGEIDSIFDKEVENELTAGVCNNFRIYKDEPNSFDAWDIDICYESMPVALEKGANISVLSTGPLLGSIQVVRRLNSSVLTQQITLRRGSRRVDFKTEIDWRETHRLLKVAFPVNFHANEAVHEIQFGHIKRSNHRSRKFDVGRFEVCNHKWSALIEEGRGFALLNDCKYGLNVLGKSINLTLLKSPVHPDVDADFGKHEFTYSFYTWNGSFQDCDLIREGYQLNCPIKTAAGDAGVTSLFSISAQNVILETVKPAEDGSGDIIVRMYEAKRTSVRCTLETPLNLAEVWRTDMLEKREKAVRFEKDNQKDKILLEFRPFEIKTIRLTVDRGNSHFDKLK